MANQVVKIEKRITATTPAFSTDPALFFPISFFRFINSKAGIATAGKIQAWNAIEKTINAGGRCFRNTEPKVKNRANRMSQRDCVEWIFLGFPV